MYVFVSGLLLGPEVVVVVETYRDRDCIPGSLSNVLVQQRKLFLECTPICLLNANDSITT